MMPPMVWRLETGPVLHVKMGLMCEVAVAKGVTLPTTRPLHTYQTLGNSLACLDGDVHVTALPLSNTALMVCVSGASHIWHLCRLQQQQRHTE